MTKVCIPQNADELEDMLGDPGKMANLFKPENKAEFREFMGTYAKNVLNKDDKIAQQVREQTQAVVAEMLKANAQAPLDLRNDGGRDVRSDIAKLARGKGTAYNKAAKGAALDNVDGKPLFEDSSEFFQAVCYQHDTMKNAGVLAAKRAKATEIRNSFGSEVPADGGFLIPETLRSDLLMWSLEHSIVRPLAHVIPMSTLRVPIPMIDSTSNVNSVFGGIVAYWTEEGASITESQASFGRVVLDAKKLTAFALIPNELLADAVAFGSFFEQVFPKALAFYEDYAFMQGDGVGQPAGFINCPAVASVSAESGQSTGTIVYENIVKMYARMLPSSIGNAVWIASIDTFPQLATMALSVGTGGSAVWLSNGGSAVSGGVAAPPMTILGRPVYFTEKTPQLSTTGDISFVDLSYYLIGDRQIMQAQSSEHFKFQNDQTAFRMIERLDGRPWLQSAITPKNNSSSTLSAFVQVATR